MHSYHRASHSAAMTSERKAAANLAGAPCPSGVCAALYQAGSPAWTTLDNTPRQSLDHHQRTPISHSSRPRLLDIVAARDHRYFLLHTPPPLILRLLLLPPAQTPPAQPHDRADTRDCLLFVAGTLPLRHSHRHELGTQRHANDDIPAGVFTPASLPRIDTPASHDYSTGDLGSPTPGGG